jgi:tetratricopeptide (TPR) repeat protein
MENALRLEREREDDIQVAIILQHLSDANRLQGLLKEGISQAREAVEIYERVDDAAGQGDCLIQLAWLLRDDEQLDAAEEAASRAIEILPEKGQEWKVCKSHRALGVIYQSKGEKEKAIHHFETALTTASSFGWSEMLFWVHYGLAVLFDSEDGFDKAHAHVEKAKPWAVDNSYQLGRAILLQARIYYRQHKFEDSTSEALRALEILERLGAQGDAEFCRGLLRDIEQAKQATER